MGNKCAFYDYYSQIKLLQIRTGLSMREAKIVLRSKNIQDPYEKLNYDQMTRMNAQTPERKNNTATPEKQTESPKGNRYEALLQVTNAWEEPGEVGGKRSRDT